VFLFTRMDAKDVENYSGGEAEYRRALDPGQRANLPLTPIALRDHFSLYRGHYYN